METKCARGTETKHAKEARTENSREEERIVKEKDMVNTIVPGSGTATLKAGLEVEVLNLR